MSKSFDLLEYLEDNDGYRNKAGVSFDTFEIGMVFMTSQFSEGTESPIIDLELGNELNVELFIKLFGIKSPDDMEIITHEKLWALYEVGIMKVTCLVEDAHLGQDIGFSICGDLVFHKTHYGLIARENDTKKEHLVSRDLITFDDFVSYTTNYLLIQSLSPG